MTQHLDADFKHPSDSCRQRSTVTAHAVESSEPVVSLPEPVEPPSSQVLEVVPEPQEQEPTGGEADQLLQLTLAWAPALKFGQAVALVVSSILGATQPFSQRPEMA